MKSIFKKVIIALLAIVWGVSSMKAQVNMSNYITLTVQKGQSIQFDLKAASDNTLIRVVSGNQTTDIYLSNISSACPLFRCRATAAAKIWFRESPNRKAFMTKCRILKIGSLNPGCSF